MAAACLHQASKSFLLGKLTQCETLLKTMPTDESVMTEWLQANNMAVIKDTDGSTVGTPTADIKFVLRKIRGLPACNALATLESSILYNCAMLELKGMTGQTEMLAIKEATSELEREVQKYIERYAAVLGISDSYTNLISQLTTVKVCQPDMLASLVLLCCVMSVYNMLDGDTVKALQLLDRASQLEANFKMTTKSKFTLLMKSPYENIAVDMKPNEDTSSGLQLSTVLHILRLACHFCDGQYSECLQYIKSTKEPVFPDHIATFWKYIKGYCLFRLGSYVEATNVLHELLSSASCCGTANMKARWNNIIGCCLAKQSRPSNAIQKMRESLHTDFNYLDPLHNLSLIYRHQGENNAELESLNLLVTALENRESENDSSSSIVKDEMKLLVNNSTLQTTARRNARDSEITYTYALYTLAKRCLELHRYDTAANKYLDLLAVLEDTDILMQSTCAAAGGSEESFCLPDADVIYLEASLALYNAGQHQDAIILCDQIMCKLTASCPSSQSQTEDVSAIQDAVRTSDRAFAGGDAPTIPQHAARTSDRAVRAGGEAPTIPLHAARTSDRAFAGGDAPTIPQHAARTSDRAVRAGGEAPTIPLHAARTSDTAFAGGDALEMTSTMAKRKRQMSFDGSGDLSPDSPATAAAVDLKHMHSTCSALMIQSQCYRAMEQYSKVEELLDRVLEHLKWLTWVDLDDREVGDGGTKEGTRPQLKRQRLDEEGNDLCCTHSDTSTNEPIRRSLLEIKSQAYNDKALLLIGQARFHDALRFLLKSLQLQHDNQQALYNHTLLLLKMGRKQNAKDSLEKLRTLGQACDDTLRRLDQALDI